MARESILDWEKVVECTKRIWTLKCVALSIESFLKFLEKLMDKVMIQRVIFSFIYNREKLLELICSSFGHLLKIKII